ncbi:MAG: hypothetical protein P8K77_07875 [Polaribacter sp.]|nr:hypothetical protein [Polaribacter sp.]
MKKIAGILAFVLAFTVSTQAQKGEHHKKRMHKGNNLTVEQKTTLAVKRLALTLDLSNAQMQKIKPLIAKQMSERAAMHKKMKAAKAAGKKKAAKGHFEKMNKTLDAKLVFQSKMKKILTEKQYDRFKKLKSHKKRKMKGEMKEKMAKRKKMRKHANKEH